MKDVLGETLVDYHEISGGHLIFFVGKDQSYFTDRILPLVQKYNPL